MQRPSLSLILSGIFLAYIVHAIYSLSLLFVVPKCEIGEKCVKTYLRKNPSLDLCMFVSTMSRPADDQAFYVHGEQPFDYSTPQEMPVAINIPAKTRDNGTLFLHIMIVPKSGANPKSFRIIRQNQEMAYSRIKLTQFMVPQAETFNLLGDRNSEGPAERRKKEIQGKSVSHLRSRVTFTMMTDDIEIPLHKIPMEIAGDMRITSDGTFLPIVKYDFLQTRHQDLVPIDKYEKSSEITIIYNPVSFGKLRLMLQTEVAMHSLKNIGFSDKDIDEAKRIYADTNFYLLAGTIFIVSLHLVFDFLAFKNDISFWRSKSNLQGLSATTIVWRAFSQAVIFLYLLESNSTMLIVIPAGIGTLIELWKVKKILRLEITNSGGFLPKIKVSGSGVNSDETKTRQFDAECMRYLSYLLYPLVTGGAIYSLIYQPHKSWYSWSINSLVNGVYAFGFLFMFPQLFVNYKLKSVAHLPWRSFMYKAFNTFIDDVFAFIITMPVAHRVACFRDDAVFLIYLYQRWLYPVDKCRIDTATIMQEPSGSSLPQSEEKKND